MGDHPGDDEQPKLAGGAILLAGVAGIALGTLAAYRVGRVSDRAISSIGIIGMSVPQYWVGMVLIVIFAVQLGVLPATGMGNPSDPIEHPIQSHGVADGYVGDSSGRHPLPFRALDRIGSAAERIRAGAACQRPESGPHLSACREECGAAAARDHGPAVRLSPRRLDPGREVFAWPGTGFLLNQAIFTRDLPIIQGTVLVLAMFFVLTNLLVDILQMFFDPRLNRRAEEGPKVVDHASTPPCIRPQRRQPCGRHAAFGAMFGASSRAIP